jgi:hypothetical protein
LRTSRRDVAGLVDLGDSEPARGRLVEADVLEPRLVGREERDDRQRAERLQVVGEG